MSAYNRVETTYEVWAAIKKAHPELAVFSSYSAPGGDFFGNPEEGKMFTSYGFRGQDYPIMEAETTWDINSDKSRINEKHQYWLVCPREEGD